MSKRRYFPKESATQEQFSMDSDVHINPINADIFDALAGSLLPQTVLVSVGKRQPEELALRQADVVLQETIRLAKEATQSAVTTISNRAWKSPDTFVRHHLLEASGQVALIASRLTGPVRASSEKQCLKRAVEITWDELSSEFPRKISSLDGQFCSSLPTRYLWKMLLIRMISREMLCDAIRHAADNTPVRGQLWTAHNTLYLELQSGKPSLAGEVLQRAERREFLAALVDCLHLSIRPTDAGIVLGIPLKTLT
jgi:hypothetical protein